MNRTFRVDLLRFEGARPVPETAALLAKHLEVEAAEARTWVTKSPATIASGLSAPEAQGVIARLMPHGAHLLMVNERTGHQTRYPESTLTQRIATGAHPARGAAPAQPVAVRTKLPQSLKALERPDPAELVARKGSEKPSGRSRGARGNARSALREKLTRTGEARARRRRLFEARGAVAMARRRIRTISVVGLLLVAAAVAFWRAQIPQDVAPTEVDGPYSFGPPGYDYVSR